jgi:radical SAM superfamily enzyme YgiQ (UPF0313 family)
LEAAKGSGCLGLEFGIDTASPGTLAAMGKNFTLQDIRRAADLCHQLDLSFCFSLLLGGPGETMSSVQETLDRVARLQPTAVICMTGIRLFPGTRLERLAVQEGLLPEDWDPLEPFFYCSPQVREKIEERLQEFSRDHANWIFPGLGIDLDPVRAEKMRRMGLKGPLWTYLRPKKRGKRAMS